MLMSLALSSRDISIYGLINSLSPLYILAVAILVFAFLLQVTSNPAMNHVKLIQFVLLETYIWGIPAFFYPGLRFPASAHDLFFYSSIASVVSTGHLSPQLYTYQGWPFPYILVSVIWKVVGPISFIMISKSTPFLLNLFASLMVLNLLRSYFRLESHLAMIGVLFFQLFNYTEQFTTFAPFSLAFVLYYSCVFWILPRLLKRSKLKISIKDMVVLLLFIAALSLTHPVIAALLTGGLLFMSCADATILKSLELRIFLLSSLLIIIWGLYFPATSFIDYNLQYVLRNPFLVLNSFVGGTVSTFASASPAHLLVDSVKTILLLLLIGTAIPAFLIGVRSRNLVLFRVILFSVGTVGVAVTIGGLQGGTINTYWLASVLPLLILFDLVTISFLKRWNVLPILFVLLTLSVPLSYLVLYGNIATESVPYLLIPQSNFYSTYDSMPSVTGQQTVLSFGLLGYYGTNLNTIYPYLYILVPPYCQCTSSLHENFIQVGQSNRLSYLYQFGNDSILNSVYANLFKDRSFDLIYSVDGNNIFYNSKG